LAIVLDEDSAGPRRVELEAEVELGAEERCRVWVRKSSSRRDDEPTAS
jgi:hypothetical protein